MNRPTRFFVPFISAACAILLAYPLSTSLNAVVGHRVQTILSYVVATLLVSVICWLVASAAGRILAPVSAARLWGGAVIVAASAFTIQAVISYLLGPVQLDTPVVGLRGIFFAEWEFLRFIVNVAIPTAVVAALTYVYDGIRGQAR